MPECSRSTGAHGALATLKHPQGVSCVVKCQERALGKRTATVGFRRRRRPCRMMLHCWQRGGPFRMLLLC